MGGEDGRELLLASCGWVGSDVLVASVRTWVAGDPAGPGEVGTQAAGGEPERPLRECPCALSTEPCWGLGYWTGAFRCDSSCWELGPAGERPPLPPAAAQSYPEGQGSVQAGPGGGVGGVGGGGLLLLLLELCQVSPWGLGQLLTGSSPLHSPGPRLVFNRVNGRRPAATSPSLEGTQETYTLAHEENVRFVSEGSVRAGG